MLSLLTASKSLLRRTGLLLVLLFAMSGCTTKIAYHYLDFAILWYFERYVKLDKDQKALFKRELDTFHVWHRTSQLPIYALYLEGLKVRLSTGELSGAQMHSEVDQLQVYLDDCLNYLMPLFIETAASLSDAQVQELLDNVAKDRADYRKEFVDVSEDALHKARIKELKSHLDLAISSFTPAQEQMMLDWSLGLTPFEALTLQQQEIWGADLKQALAQRHNRTALQAALKKLIFVHTDHWEPELERILDTNQARTYQVLADIINSLDSKQRKKMNKRLDNYVEDFRELAVALKKRQS